MTAKTKPAPRKKAPGAQRKPANHDKRANDRSRAETKPEAAEKPGWGKIAAIGAAGAGVAALVYALRGKPAAGPSGDAWPAHQADGRNSSDQFSAQIADENMIPERVPEAIV